MAQKGPLVIALSGQLGIRAVSKENIVGMIMGGVTTVGYTALGTTVRITSLQAAKDLGFTAAYDVTNGVYVYGAFKEFYRLNPDGIVYFMIVNRSSTMVSFGSSFLPALAQSSVVRPNERIASFMYKRNPLNTFEAVQVNEIWNEILPAMVSTKNAKELLESHGIFPGIVIIDGSFCTNQYGDYEDLRAQDNETCAVCIGNDTNWAQSLTAYNSFADPATMLGLIAMRSASESMAAPIVKRPPANYKGQIFNNAVGRMVSLTETLISRYLFTGFSSGEDTSQVSDVNLELLRDMGYNYFDRIYNVNGKYGVNGATCGAATSDYAWIERYQIVQKAKHYAYQFFAPLKNMSVELKDSKLTEEIRSYLENEATNAILGQLRFEDNISEFQDVEGAGVILPSDYNFVTGEHETDPGLNVFPETLVVKIAIPIKGILRETTIYVGLKA